MAATVTPTPATVKTRGRRMLGGFPLLPYDLRIIGGGAPQNSIAPPSWRRAGATEMVVPWHRCFATTNGCYIAPLPQRDCRYDSTLCCLVSRSVPQTVSLLCILGKLIIFVPVDSHS